MRDTVQGIGNGLPFFGRSAMVKGENALPFVDFTLRSLQSLLHLGPVRFKNCGLIGFVPSGCHLQGPLKGDKFPCAGIRCTEIVPFRQGEDWSVLTTFGSEGAWRVSSCAMPEEKPTSEQIRLEA
jgi:hypothetical protein